ncbi:MAG TPA: hypothetical protein VM733_02470 [Thermoanaerobaculia bacterium]|nr:hypothetical protein [Thermoanaerobaculia bacterium]
MQVGTNEFHEMRDVSRLGGASSFLDVLPAEIDADAVTSISPGRGDHDASIAGSEIHDRVGAFDPRYFQHGVHDVHRRFGKVHVQRESRMRQRDLGAKVAFDHGNDFRMLEKFVVAEKLSPFLFKDVRFRTKPAIRMAEGSQRQNAFIARRLSPAEMIANPKAPGEGRAESKTQKNVLRDRRRQRESPGHGRRHGDLDSPIECGIIEVASRFREIAPEIARERGDENAAASKASGLMAIVRHCKRKRPRFLAGVTRSIGIDQ